MVTYPKRTGVSYDGEMIAGFVYNPYAEELYSAVRGYGACINGQHLHVVDKTIENGIIAYGCARYNEGDTDALFLQVPQRQWNR